MSCSGSVAEDVNSVISSVGADMTAEGDNSASSLGCSVTLVNVEGLARSKVRSKKTEGMLSSGMIGPEFTGTREPLREEAEGIEENKGTLAVGVRCPVSEAREETVSSSS